MSPVPLDDDETEGYRPGRLIPCLLERELVIDVPGLQIQVVDLGLFLLEFFLVERCSLLEGQEGPELRLVEDLVPLETPPPVS